MMNSVNLDKETLKELRGKLLAQEKEQSRARNSKEGRQKIQNSRNQENTLSESTKEQKSNELKEDEEFEMEM